MRGYPRRRQSGWAGSLIAVLALLAGACGSTVDGGRAAEAGALTDSRDRSTGDIRAGLDFTGEPAGPGTEPGASPTGGSASGTSVGPGSAPPAASSRQASVQTTGPASDTTRPREMGKGVTTDSVAIGVMIARGYERTSEALGLQGANLGDGQQQVDAILAHINAHGGMAGRQVEPIYHYIDSADGQSGEVRQQSACTTWTQDHETFGAVYPANQAHVVRACLGQRDTPLVSEGLGLYGETVFAEHPGRFYQPGLMDAHRTSRVYIDGLVRQGFFTPGARIGLIRSDDISYERASEEALKPALRRHGLELDEEVAVTTTVGPGNAQINNAVLRFRSSGITHVLMLDYGAGVALFFMTSAESQAYRPLYGLNSISAPEWIRQNVPATQMQGVTGVGWAPNFDVGLDREPPPNAIRQTCRQIFAEAGIVLSDRLGEGVALVYCDSLFFFKAGLDRAQALTTEGFRESVATIGDGYDSPVTFVSRFGPTRFDGAHVVRDFAYDTACNCMKYTSPPYVAGG